MAGTAGSVAPVFRDGGYDDTVIYDFYHALIHNNKLYFCRQDGTIGHEPQEESDEYWFLSLDGNFGDAKKLGGETAAQWQTKIDVEKSRIDALIALEESSELTDVEKEVNDIKVGADGVTYGTAGTAVRTQIANVNTKMDTEIGELKSDLGEEITLLHEAISVSGNWKDSEFDTLETGIVYRSDKALEWSGGKTYTNAVTSGEKYRITTIVPPNDLYYAVLFYSNDVLVGMEYQGENLNATELTDYEFTVPTGADCMRCSVYSATNVSLKKLDNAVNDCEKENAKNYVHYDGDTLSVKSRYNASEDIVFSLKKRGANNLFDFHQIYCVEHKNILDDSLVSSRLILNNGTDFFSPHQVRAIGNIDGDESTNYFLTGGNHDKDGVATAYCDNVKVWVDKSLVSTFDGNANEIVVEWTNHITGHNTFKADGTGRTILDETIVLKIVGTKIDVCVEHIPTENIYHAIYYGLQAVNTPYTTLRYIGGSNRTEIAPTEETNSGSLACKEIIAKNTKTGDMLITKIEDCDLGTFEFTGEAYSAFTKNVKSYFAILRNKTITQNENDLYVLRGSYEFLSK